MSNGWTICTKSDPFSQSIYAEVYQLQPNVSQALSLKSVTFSANDFTKRVFYKNCTPAVIGDACYEVSAMWRA